ncbi:type IV secretion system DNA-binding domain-containing protein [Lichenifustis flavocetrariae]|uniref:Type IV secretion system DNA-binding domain-containing protein n=1 Tax=Lichenifustis flavocetrariae TaxID=2949735 RepID=A0AA41Z1V6_9HYPH|nr:type IV secretion system DNA-binding domain-containing protein [Lichenifustis flavocetrariae]MCW6511323.1 type IV secretion system DNA-binding domain-containing protein [Lichenifustis flavocetrariae]
MFGPLASPSLQKMPIDQRLEKAAGISRNTAYNAVIDLFTESLARVLRSTDEGDDALFLEDTSEFDLRVTTAFHAGLVFAFPFTVMVWFATRRKRNAVWVDGPSLIEGPQAASKAKTALSEALLRGHTIDLAPGVPLTKDREVRSFMLLGGQRSGKTVVLRSWLRQLIDAKHKLIVHDTKGDMTESWPNDDFILLAPHDARSWGWDIGRDIQGQLNFEFAAALCPEGKEAQWAQGGQQIMTGILIALQRQHGTAWGWKELCAAIQQSPVKIYDMIVSNYPMAAQFAALENGEFTKTSSSYFTTLLAPVARLIQPLAAAWGDLDPKYQLSISDWISDQYKGPRTLILQRMPQFAETSRLWISAVIEHMIAYAGGGNLKNNDDRRIWLALDEFPQLGKIKSLFEVPASHAAKGMTLIMAYQSLGQAKEAYGPEALGLLGQLTDTKIIFRVQGEDAGYVADKFIGPWRYEYSEFTWADDGTFLGKLTTVRRSGEGNLVLPSYFGNLRPTADGVEGLALGLDGGDVYRLSWPYEDWPDQREPSVPASWVSKLPPAP